MTARGKFVFTLIILGLAGFGIWKWWDKLEPALFKDAKPASTAPAATAAGQPATAPASKVDTEHVVGALVEPLTSVPTLAPAGTYIPKDNIIDVDISEYAAYSGLILANGGLSPTEDSYFFRNHGFKVRLTLSEEEGWSRLNAGQMAASVTTADVLAVQGRGFQATVPVQFGFSRGADGVVVRKEIRKVNDLKGKTLITTQFTETDFLIRYLAQESGLEVALRSDLHSSRPNPDKINLVFTDDTFTAGDIFLDDIKSGRNQLAGCITWEPKVSEIAKASEGAAHVLITNKNLLIIADILIANRAFAQQNPKIIAGLVEGIIDGNSKLRENAEPHLDLIGKAFKWSREETRAELAKVHLSNLPENLAFFNGSIDSAGSFGGIYQTAILAYGSDIIKNPLDSGRYLDLAALKALESSGKYASQKIAIAPIRSGSGSQLETDPLLSKDIRFFFEPNSADLKEGDPTNLANFETLRRMLQISPGSMILLRGHVDNALVAEFRKQGGEAFVRQMSLKAFELSKNRATAVKNALMAKYGVDGARLETVGRGWDEPLSKTDNEQNRRVEAQWFTVE
ncbi:MAG: phosphate ABC transporter substrate-binding/OmpA family protein [Verrucomicrobiota bacterium]|nr:phosphate ABC transporter substrate-binding/OmpA family protein [Verrucomicrobiota bacterium]